MNNDGRKDRSGGRAIGRGHERIGVMACLACKREIPVKKTEGGKLSCGCSWCDLPLYINPRTEAFSLVMQLVRLDAPAPADVTSASTAAAAPAPPASSSSSAPAADETKDKPPARTWAGPLFGRG